MLALLLALLVQDRPSLPAPDEDGTRTRSAESEEIVVRGNRDMTRFRTGPIDGSRWAEKPLRPQVRLPGGGQAAVHADQRDVGGVSVPAAMVTLKLPLGRKPKK
ncbi:MAG: hypothetical protein EOP59_18160 [Sphingomonadales bacterium]|nr:MAG: hypothetical protein EOP59_18160 [Sphingomonadales bacterium]